MKPTVTKDSSGGMENTESPFIEFVKTNMFETLDPPLVRCEEFIDPVYKTLKILWGSKENNDAGWLLSASLGKVTKEKECAE